MMYQLVHETGWTMHQLLWKVSRLNLLLMLADRPGHIRANKMIKKSSGRALADKLRAEAGAGK